MLPGLLGRKCHLQLGAAVVYPGTNQAKPVAPIEPHGSEWSLPTYGAVLIYTSRTDGPPAALGSKQLTTATTDAAGP